MKFYNLLRRTVFVIYKLFIKDYTYSNYYIQGSTYLSEMLLWKFILSQPYVG